MSPRVSFMPSEMVEGGAVPQDKNLLVKNASFALFDYGGRITKPTTALCLVIVDDDGEEYTQYYSAADSDRFVPSDDGMFLESKGTASALNKSSNFFLLMSNLVSAGFPENKLKDAPISVLDGLYAFWIGLKEPERAGLSRPAPVPGQKVYEKIIAVPSKIIRLPWEKAPAGSKGATTKATTTKGKAPAVEADPEVIAKGLEVYEAAVAKHNGKATRVQVSTVAFKTLSKDPLKDAVLAVLYTPAMTEALTADGFTVDGEVVSKAD